MVIRSNTPTERKTDRMEMRVTPSARAMIQRASALSGLSAGDLAYEAARRIVEQHEIIHLRGEDARAFAEALINPPEPTEALVRAMRRHAELFD